MNISNLIKNQLYPTHILTTNATEESFLKVNDMPSSVRFSFYYPKKSKHIECKKTVILDSNHVAICRNDMCQSCYLKLSSMILPLVDSFCNLDLEVVQRAFIEYFIHSSQIAIGFYLPNDAGLVREVFDVPNQTIQLLHENPSLSEYYRVDLVVESCTTQTVLENFNLCD